MVAKSKKQKINEHLINSCKFCTYPTNIEDKTIDVTEELIEDAKEDLSVLYLINNFGFKFQICLPGTVTKKEHYSPELKTLLKKQNENENIELPKRGEIYVFENQRLYITSITEKQCVVTILNSLQGDKNFTIPEIKQKMLLWKLEPKI